jgi:signal transduction histidine kinase
VPREDNSEVTGTPSSGSRLSLRNWKLRSKLALVLAIPTLTALVLGVLRVQDELSQARQFDQTTSQVDLASKATDVVQGLQTERMLAIAKIINPGDAQVQTALTSQMATVDRAVNALNVQASQLEVSDPASAQRYQRGIQRLDALPALRASVNTPPYSELAAFTTYTSVIDSLVQLGREVTSSVADQELLRAGTTLQAVSEAKEFMVRQDAALEIAAMRNTFSNIVLDQIRAAQYSSEAAIALFQDNATPQQLQQYTDTVSGPEVDGRARLVAMALAHADNNEPPGINRDTLATDSAVTLGKLRSVETSLLSDLRARSGEMSSQATIAAWRDVGIVFGALVLALVLTFFVTRTMLKPLRALRRSALDIAYTRLPETVHKILADPDPVAASKNAVEPVPVTTREEIGELARSFDAVHEQAIKMAAEQALLRENVNGIFVNLSRRSQRLVERQLGVIDRLEADEQDPDHLASLFELDHLSTRLRRNGESLLVLSGAGLAKSVPKPVSAADVIGAAVSEIEQYARVEVGVIPDVAVRGLTVHDLVHLLAELLDNATYFSEPETKVSVRAVVSRRRALALQITDRGVGMSEEQLAEANKRLADPPDLDVSVTRRMGLYVVARLAKRHGVEVRLRENEDIEGGVIARIVVPAELLGPVVEEAPPPPGQSPSEISWPAEESGTPEPEVSAPSPRPPSVAEQTAADGLRPLAQPISLDDLVAGSSKAAFLSQGGDPASPHQGNGSDNGNGSDPGTGGEPGGDSGNGYHEAPTPLELPKRQPEYVPVTRQAESPSLPPARELDEDDIPTRRLPIYQSVVSRWFSTEDEENAAGPLDEPSIPAATQTLAQLGDFAAVAVEPRAESPAETEPEAESAAVAVKEAESSWHSVADEGWQAAQALLESKSEEITSAGLPKRVPNAYLVPGSVSSGEQDAFVDRTVGQPGRSAIARSATAARDRMVSFQRGYTSGRHALRGGAGEESVSVNGGDSASPETAVRSDE